MLASSSPPAPRAIRVLDCAIHHVDTGAPHHAHPDADGDADAVLLLPGIIATHRYFQHTIAPLARRYRVLAPDLPGFGRSDKPDAPYTIDWFARVALGLLDAAGVGRAHVVGNSLGGQIAMAVARLDPARVARLVLVAPAGISTRWLGPSGPILDVMGRAVPHLAPLPFVPRAPAAAFMKLVFHHTFPGRPDLARRYLRGYRRAIHSDDYALYLRALFRAAEGCVARPMLDEARAIPHETLLVWGRRDRLLPVGAAEELRRAMPRARLVVYDRSGHVPMEDAPDRFNHDVLAFLAEPKDAG